jgi:tRNA(Ile)-lysidine synthase
MPGWPASDSPPPPSDDSATGANAVVTPAALLGRCTFPAAGTPVVCGVSGGADSLALLVLARAAGCLVTAVHVDHGLRPGSRAEAAAVLAAAERLGAAAETRRVTIRPGPNLDARARQARLEALGPGALLGHTADDQAETILLNLMRGSGLDGLAGMRPGCHPLLAIRRWETHWLCEHLGLQPLQDPSNQDPTHRRNRVRHEVLPLLDRVAQRDVAAVVAGQAAVLRDDAELLDQLAAALDPTDARSLAAAPVALARRAVRRWLARPYPPDSATVERVLAVARGEARGTDLPGGRHLRRSGGRLLVEPPTTLAR